MSGSCVFPLPDLHAEYITSEWISMPTRWEAKAMEVVEVKSWHVRAKWAARLAVITPKSETNQQSAEKTQKYIEVSSCSLSLIRERERRWNFDFRIQPWLIVICRTQVTF